MTGKFKHDETKDDQSLFISFVMSHLHRNAIGRIRTFAVSTSKVIDMSISWGDPCLR